MRPTRPKGRHPISPRSRAARDDASRRLVLEALGTLLGALERIQGEGQPPPDLTEGGFATWQDDETVYLEANLPDSSKANVDISIWEGRVFIRVTK